MKNQKALTLIEILITVAILSLLVGIAVPNYFHTRSGAQENACQSNMGMIEAAIEQWALDESQPSGTDIATNEGAWDDYLRGGTLPSCPTSGSYGYTGNGTSGTLGDYRVTCSDHGDITF